MVKDKTLIFVSCNKQISNLHKVLKDIEQEVVLIASPQVSMEDLVDLEGEIICRKFEGYETSTHNAKICSDEAWQLIEEWGDLKIDGKNSPKKKKKKNFHSYNQHVHY